jgi:two-component system, sensor histidine kinase and response regulator
MQDVNNIKYKSAFMETVDAMIISDGSTGKIIDVNRACCSLLGFTEYELLGRQLSGFFSEKSQVGFVDPLTNTNMFGGVLSNRIVKNKNGEFIPVDMTINTFEGHDSNCIMTTLRDGRERMRYENEILLKNKELNESNASKDKLFSIIAHDLKNPLMALMGLSELMADDCKEVSQDEISKMFNSINQLSKETYDLLDNLLSWSRVQTKKIDIEIREIQLRDLVSKIINILKPSAELKKISIINSVPKMMRINADENMIKTVIRNFISNSIKFSNANASVTVEAYEDDKNNIVAVTDEGVGMEESYIANLFDPGIKTSQYGTNREKGTGLGLLLCHEFIKLHNGIIKVSSKVGKGSQFQIQLPK